MITSTGSGIPTLKNYFSLGVVKPNTGRRRRRIQRKRVSCNPFRSSIAKAKSPKWASTKYPSTM